MKDNRVLDVADMFVRDEYNRLRTNLRALKNAQEEYLDKARHCGQQILVNRERMELAAEVIKVREIFMSIPLEKEDR